MTISIFDGIRETDKWRFVRVSTAGGWTVFEAEPHSSGVIWNRVGTLAAPGMYPIGRLVEAWERSQAERTGGAE